MENLSYKTEKPISGFIPENKKSTNELIENIVTSFLERRNYVESITYEKPSYTLTSEQMAVALFTDKAAARVNSILYTSTNNEPTQVMHHYLKWLKWLCNIKCWQVQKELWFMARPLLCHLYLETLKNGCRYQDKLQQCFIRLQNEYDKLHKAYLETVQQEFDDDISKIVLDKLQEIHTQKDIESHKIVMTFRSCKFLIQLSSLSVNVLINYLTRHGHVLLLQILQTWFDIEVKKNDNNDLDNNSDENVNENYQENGIEHIQDLSRIDTDSSQNDIYLLRNLEESITQLNNQPQPILLYSIYNTQNNNAVSSGCTDKNLELIAYGFENAEIKLWRRSCLPLMVPKSNYASIEIACTEPNNCDTDNEQDSKLIESVLRGHNGRIHGLSFLNSSPYLLSVSHDSTMRAWDLRENICKVIYSGHNYPIWCLDTSAFSMYIATGSQDKTLRIWSPESIYPLRICIGHALDVNCTKFHPNSLYVASGSADCTVCLWNVTDGSLVRLMSVQRPVFALDFSPDGRYLASAGDDRIVSIWDLANGNRLTELHGHLDTINYLHWSNNYLYSASLDGNLKLWTNPEQQCNSGSSESFATINNCSLQSQADYDIDLNCNCVVNIQNVLDQIVCLGVRPYQNKD